MPQNCLGTIRSFYPKFSEKEKKIADYILQKPEIIIHRTINEVADDLNIADATVFRFSKRIGFKGFQAMKIALASETMTPVRPLLEEIPEKENEKTLTEKIFTANIRALQTTLEHIDSTSLKTAIDLILQANRVEVFGTGASAIIAMAASQKLLSVGVRANAYTDAHSQLLAASLLSGTDVALFISHSGASKETLTILKTTNETGAKAIAINGFPNSPLSLNAEVALLTSSEETDSFSATFATQIAQLTILDALCLNICHQKENSALIDKPLAETKA